MFFWLIYFPDPLEVFPKFARDCRPWGEDDCTVQRVQARQQGFSRLVRLFGKFALITLVVIQALAGMFSLLPAMHGCMEQRAGPLQ